MPRMVTDEQGCSTISMDPVAQPVEVRPVPEYVPVEAAVEKIAETAVKLDEVLTAAAPPFEALVGQALDLHLLQGAEVIDKVETQDGTFERIELPSGQTATVWISKSVPKA